MDYTGKKIKLSLSAGINSTAVACWLIESGMKPKEIHVVYCHLEEHSPESMKFVEDMVALLRKHFSNVLFTVFSNSALSFFKNEKLIPHPIASPCSLKLKIEPSDKYSVENNVFIDLVGYVKSEMKKRAERQQDRLKKTNSPHEKHYPIGEFTDEWCFQIVERVLGWYPEIYKHKWSDPGFIDFLGKNKHRMTDYDWNRVSKKMGKDVRVFLHNNCLPCKNMDALEILYVQYFYPSYYANAMDLSSFLKSYWGRNADTFYFTFGRDLNQDSTCENCKF